MNITQKQSPNFYSTTYKLDTIVLHTTLGNINSTLSHLTNPSSNVSAHFVIDRDGNITQLVSLTNAAWHAGYKYNMSQRAKDVIKKDLLGRYINPNKQCIGIEVASGYDIDGNGTIDSIEKLYSAKQLTACVNLILYCEKQLGITYDDKHILTHKDIASYKPDLEVQRTVTLVALDAARRKLTESTPPNNSSSSTTEQEIFTISENDVGTIEVKNNTVVITNNKKI